VVEERKKYRRSFFGIRMGFQPCRNYAPSAPLDKGQLDNPGSCGKWPLSWCVCVTKAKVTGLPEQCAIVL